MPDQILSISGVTSTYSNVGAIHKRVNHVVAVTGNTATGQLWTLPTGVDGVHMVPCLPITYREDWDPVLPTRTTVKGSTLTNLEIDANFKVLQDAIITWQETEEWARAIIANRFMNIVDVYNDTPARLESTYIERPNPLVTNGILDKGYRTAGYELQQTQSYNNMIRFFNTTPKSLIIPADADFTFPIGSAVIISWNGGTDATVSVIGDPGVTIISPDTNEIARRYGKITCIKTAPNYWELEGNLAFDYTI